MELPYIILYASSGRFWFGGYKDGLPNHQIFQLYGMLFMFGDCRTTFLGLLCWRSSGLASSRLAGTGWRAVKDTPDGCKLYPWMGGYQLSELLQEVTWRLLLVVYLKLNGLLVTIYDVLLIFSSPWVLPDGCLKPWVNMLWNSVQTTAVQSQSNHVAFVPLIWYRACCVVCILER